MEGEMDTSPRRSGSSGVYSHRDVGKCRFEPGRTGWVMAAVSLTAGVSMVLFARPIVRALMESRVPLFLGSAPEDHYIWMARSTGLVWSFLLPLLVVVGFSLWRLLRCVPDWPGCNVQPAVALAAMAAVLVAGGFVPRVPSGDEPAYLIMARSLLRDGDVQAPEAGGEFHRSPCAKPGVAVSVHPPGLSAVIAIPDRLLGERGARLAVAATGILLGATLIPILGLVVDSSSAVLIALLLSVTFPLAPFSGVIFPDLPAAACLAIVGARLLGAGWSLGHAAVAVVLLPWLNPRFLPPTVLLLAWGWIDHRVDRRTSVFLSVSFVVTLGWMAWLHVRWFGSPSPFAARWCAAHLFKASTFFTGILGVLVDQQYGLLVWAPLFILMPAGWVLLWRRSWKAALGVLVLIGATCIPGLMHNWTAGWSPAARYLVPALPFIVPFLALAIHDGLRAPGWRCRVTRLLILAQMLIGAVALVIPGKLMGTLETHPRNYYFTLMEKVTRFDTTLVVPSIGNGPHPRVELQGALLLTVWLVFTWLWLRTGRSERKS